MKGRIRPGAAPPDAAGAILNPQRGAVGEARLAVYADGYQARIRESLQELYEAVRQVLGQAAFGELARAYASAHRSRDYNLLLAGRDLPEFLNGWPRTRELPFLPDLARLEWAVCQAFHATDGPALDASRPAALPPEAWPRIRLALQPSVRLVASDWPVLEIWAARSQPRETIAIDLKGRPQRVLVHRQGLRVRCEAIAPAPFALLEALRDGEPLERACAKLAQTPADPAVIQAWFAGWMRAGLFAELQLGA